MESWSVNDEQTANMQATTLTRGTIAAQNLHSVAELTGWVLATGIPSSTLLRRRAAGS